MAFFKKSAPEPLGNTQSLRPTIFVVTDDTIVSDMIHDIFATLVGFDVSRISMPQFIARKQIDLDAYEMAVVDLGDGAYLNRPDFLAARDHLRGLPTIFISEALGGEQMRQLIKLDGVDWLQKPLVKRTFIETILAYSKKAKAGGGQVHAVVSSGGGAGGTSVAVTMAHAHALRRKRIGNGVALFDLDFSKASCASYLNLSNEYNLDNVLGQPERVDVEFVNLITKRHSNGMSVYSFYKPEVGIAPQGRDLVLRMLDIVAYQNDQVVIDLPFYATSWKDSILQSVNTVWIVATSTVPSLEMAKLQYLHAVNIRKSSDNIKILINKHRKSLFGAEPAKAQVEKIFGVGAVEFVPEENDLMLEAINRGVLPIDVNGSSKFSSAISALVKAQKSKVVA